MPKGRYTEAVQTYLRGGLLKEFKLEVATGLLGISQSEVAKELIKLGLAKLKDERNRKK